MAVLRVVVLGGSGFIGGELASHLEGMEGLAVERYSSRDLDLARPGSARRLAELLDPRSVLVAAARSRRPTDSPAHFEESVAMDSAIARALEESPVKRCIYLSSLAVHGESATDLGIREERPPAPGSWYGLAKAAGELALARATREARSSLAVLRASAVYGSGDPASSYGPGRFVRTILAEGVARLQGDGSDRRDHLFIRDLLRVVARLITSEAEGTYLVGSGRSESFRGILERLKTIADRPFEIVEEERKQPRVDLGIDNRRLLAALPGLEFTGLDLGLAETYRHFAALGELRWAPREPERAHPEPERA